MQEHLDGRTARRDRNRDAVLDAVLDLFSEGSLAPSATEVAERSGMSLRSVYRYFEDMDGLIRAVISRSLVRVRPLFEIEGLGEGPLADRVDRMVENRLGVFDTLAPMMRATALRARTNEIVREQLEDNRRALREQVEQMFAPELAGLTSSDRREVAAGLDVMLGFDAFEHLRTLRRLPSDEIAAVVSRSVTALLASAT